MVASNLSTPPFSHTLGHYLALTPPCFCAKITHPLPYLRAHESLSPQPCTRDKLVSTLNACLKGQPVVARPTHGSLGPLNDAGAARPAAVAGRRSSGGVSALAGSTGRPTQLPGTTSILTAVQHRLRPRLAVAVAPAVAGGQAPGLPGTVQAAGSRPQSQNPSLRGTGSAQAHSRSVFVPAGGGGGGADPARRLAIAEKGHVAAAALRGRSHKSKKRVADALARVGSAPNSGKPVDMRQASPADDLDGADAATMAAFVRAEETAVFRAFKRAKIPPLTFLTSSLAATLAIAADAANTVIPAAAPAAAATIAMFVLGSVAYAPIMLVIILRLPWPGRVIRQATRDTWLYMTDEWWFGLCEDAAAVLSTTTVGLHLISCAVASGPHGDVPSLQVRQSLATSLPVVDLVRVSVTYRLHQLT